MAVAEAANKVRIGYKRIPTLSDGLALESTSARESMKDFEQHSIREFVDFWF